MKSALLQQAGRSTKKQRVLLWRTVSTPSPSAGLPAALSPRHSGPGSTGHQQDAHHTCTPRLEHSEHAWPWKCHLKPN